MREVLWKFFPPFEVSIYKKHVAAFLRRNFEDRILYLDLFGIEEEAIKFGDANPQFIVEEIRLKHTNVEELAIRSVLNICRKRLRSGEMHNHSGGLTYTGIRLLELVRAAFKESTEKGFIKEEDADRIFARLQQSLEQ